MPAYAQAFAENRSSTTTAPHIVTAQKPTTAVIVLGLNPMTLSPALTPDERSGSGLTAVASCPSWP